MIGVRTLRGRLVVATAAVSLVTMGLLVAGLQLLLARTATNDSQALLRARTDAAAATLSFDGGRVRVRESGSDSLDRNVWVYDARGRLVDGPDIPPPISGAVTSLGASHAPRHAVVQDRFRLLSRPVSRNGEPAAVVVAGVDLTPYEETERHSLYYSVALGLLAATAAAVAASMATTFALARVRAMARTADDWREHDLHRRFALGSDDELGELAATLDGLLDRVEEAILAERRLTDEVAHELRTPLTTIRSEAELALHRGGPDESLQAIVDATTRMTASINTMLAVARAAGGQRDHAWLDDVARDAVEALPDHPVRVELLAGHVAAAAPPEVLVALLGPLIDNATRHAGSRVRVSTEADRQHVRLVVSDDGPGFSTEAVQRAMDPGFTTSGDGAGLGLPLAARLARSVRGTVRIEPADHGRVVVELPAASSPG